MEQLIDFHAPEVQAVLDTLLKDKSTGKNIIWATDPPEELQTVMYEPVTDRSQITTQQLGLTHYEVVLPRMMKQTDTQQQRTRKKGEVFSPAWVCNKMNNALDADWFRALGAEESAGQFFHILGGVAHPRGCAHLPHGYEITVYTSCCNADTGVYYYTTYGNHQITAVDMHRENLDGDRLVRYPLVQGEQIALQN